MEADADAEVGLQVVQIELRPLRRDLAGVEEEGHVERDGIGVHRHSACSSRLLRSRKRQLGNARSVLPLPSEGIMK